MPLPLLTARLAIRPYDPDDAEQMHEVLYGDPDAMRFVGGAVSLDETQRMARRYAEDHVREGMALWVVEERETGFIVGEAGLHPFDDRGPEIELGCAFGAAHWGKGFATEAGRAILAEAFGPLGLTRVVAVAHDEHVASQRVLAKLGFVAEGRRTVRGHDQRYFACTAAPL